MSLHSSNVLNNSDHAKALNYMCDFSTQAQHFRDNRSEEALVLLNRSVSILSTAIQPQQCFIRNNLTISRFFIDLHSVMSSLPVDNDTLWSCVTILQQYSRNLDAHQAIVEEYRFVPLLTHILQSIPTTGEGGDRRQRLLALLQHLTFGIQISWEEPYVVVLLKQLIDIIYEVNDKGSVNTQRTQLEMADNNIEVDDEELQAQISLSILINICYKNFVVLFLFLRTVNISQFSRHIQRYGMLANKMLIVLSDDIYSPDRNELNAFLKSSFASIGECLKTWNLPQLKHTVEFLKDSRSHKVLHQTMLSYRDYSQDITNILNLLNDIENSTANENNEEERRKQQICMSILFELLEYILELSRLQNADANQEPINLRSTMLSIYELLIKWVEEDICGVSAINLLITLLESDGDDSEVTLKIARDSSIIVKLITISEKTDISPDYTVCVLRLLCALLSQAKTEKLVLAKISESYFDKIMLPVVSLKPEMPDNCLTRNDIEKSVFCILLLVNFAAIAKKAYYEKCCSLLQIPQVQKVLARALFNSGCDKHVSAAVFRISHFQHFPCNDVALYIAELNKVTPNRTASLSTQTTTKTEENQRNNFNLALRSQRMFASKELEERLQALIDSLTESQRYNQLTNANTSQIIELFNYKLDRYSIAEEQMQYKLQQASEEVTCLRQRINAQNAELDKYRTMNLELHIKQESLLVECNDLKTQIKRLKNNVTDLMKKLSEKADIIKITEKRLTVKTSELMVLQEQHGNLKAQYDGKVDEVEKLQATAKENTSRIEKLKKTISVFEQDLKEKTQRIEEKERELIKTSKLLEEQREAKTKLDEVVNVLEAQLQEKNEQIRNYETELNETEELRKTIMSLMESKKPKRKT